MANFPNSPTINQIYTDPTTGFSFRWDGTVWSSYSPTVSLESGFSTPLSTSSTDLLSNFYKTTQSITVGTGTTLYVNNTDSTTGNIVFSKLSSVRVASGATFHVGAGTTLLMNVLGVF